MKQKCLSVSVEKILEKKKRQMEGLKSNLLPLISHSEKNHNESNFPASRNTRYVLDTYNEK